MATHARKQIRSVKQPRKLTRTVTVRDVPVDILERLKERAELNHRSLQGEMIAILEQSAGPRTITVDEMIQRIKALNFKTQSDSAQIVREMRDAR